MGARILVVGGGYIGMYAARHLERRLRGTAHELVLVNPDNFMLYQPFLPEVASGLIDPLAVVVPLRRVLREPSGLGQVERLERGRTASVRLGGGVAATSSHLAILGPAPGRGGWRYRVSPTTGSG